ncbi:glycoside hydrolase family 20 zincin-like fold domain-containing protein [Clostridium boliviensis]|uniref:Glycoside hydrolase family 20 zincin-like fold domain-containing protein n=2 Tax=Bacillota TaxID=1239 RepID=A0ABU4GH47_9CLOT|nr:glycoside hydrolase family 20 zincin-like fold domain-containing protein [Clostridium boliviensis]MDW2796273.1 glycoside hydrolase family 20 zincin-like fold domain-containing protein [Clostridium boliviensis]
MFEKRDLCWLLKPVNSNEIVTWFMEDKKDSTVARTIEYEMPLLFHGISRSQKENASVVLILTEEGSLGEEGYSIDKKESGYEIKGSTQKGLLYGIFGLHRLLMCKKGNFPYISIPDQNYRMINHWDNFDGTIERGYAGSSIFFDHNEFRGDMDLIRQYARLLASVGINAVSINNVNVHKYERFFITADSLKEIKKIGDIFTAYGIKIFLAIDFAAPISVGKLSTADPLCPEVDSWWKQNVEEIYKIIPDFGGFVVKADSEHEPGPFTYGRSHGDGANMLAKAVLPYGGIIVWRCFVYDCTQDWRDRSLDRARAAYDLFKDLDGGFDENVILQIKNGPVDFQIREPVSPLLGSLKKTNQILEFQITQEYTGHQIDICYLVPMWKETMDFDTGHGVSGQVKKAIRDYSPIHKLSGLSAVGNVGMDRNWTGNKMAQANWYGYGRLAWDNNLTSGEIAEEWLDLSFELTKNAKKKALSILLSSRDTYEDYTCPLAVGFMCKPGLHYGCDIDGYEYDCWGTYHYADRDGLGRDRTAATGTGYTKQYSPARFEEYEDIASCPDELLLFFHHVPYTHKLHSGKSVIQHIYDTHFSGVEKVKEYQTLWESIKEDLDEDSYQNVKERLNLQLKHAIEWRDQVNTYFYRKSGIPDEAGRTIYD